MPSAVRLNLYNLVPGKVNQGLQALGTGAFHAGVEVYGLEYSYGFQYKGTGIFTSQPRQCAGPEFLEAIEMGETTMSEESVSELVNRLKEEWIGAEYDLLRHNCCIFSNAFCEKLGVGSVPSWVTSLAAAGATVGNGVLAGKDAAQRAAVIAAAKAGQIDEKYHIRGTAEARAQDFLEAAKTVDGRFHIREKAAGAAAKASQLASKAVTGRAQAEPRVEGEERGAKCDCVVA
mmetsp:Transcript_14291/g.30016  ORF Transcript_14291/g.30016 Transcript_14291/m.30016 type:complete len:232 (+) Transcript_14291:65-760(+)